MKRLLDWLWGRVILFAIIAAGLAVTALIQPLAINPLALFRAENASLSDMQAAMEQEFALRQADLAGAAQRAKTQSAAELQQRITTRKEALEKAKADKDTASQGLFAAYRPSKLVANAKAEIAIAAISEEITVLEAALEPRRTLEAGQSFMAANPTMLTEASLAKVQADCDAAAQELERFKQRWKIDQGLREALQLERSTLAEAKQQKCDYAATEAAKRAAALAARKRAREARAQLDAIRAAPLPDSAKAITSMISPRDIALKALGLVLLITLTPFAYRVIAYYALAPIAVRWPPMRFAPAGATLPQPVATPSAISVAITLGADDEALVRQDYLQSSSLTGAKRTRWLLDWRHPVASLASGMRFLTAVRGEGERVTLSAVKDPFAELAVLTLSAGAGCVLRPSALAGVVEAGGQPLRITSHWRIFSLPALLTWQWRYLAFHGPAQLVVKGGRGVRIEAADRGRIVGERQILGFSTDLAYAVIRSETFWPYFFGREALLKDRVEAGTGVLLIEEAPLAGRSGLRRGFEGFVDALLKVGGV
jgi:hypothetical protein